MTTEVPHAIVRAVEAALDKKAEDPVVLDLRGLSDVTDYFLICHGNSDRQVVAIMESIEEQLRTELDLCPSHIEGRRVGDWVLMDYVDLLVHIFRDDRRQFYRLEHLWGDAPSLDLSALTSAAGEASRTRSG